MKIGWRLYFTVVGLVAMGMISYEMNVWTFGSETEANPDLVRVENVSQSLNVQEPSSDDKREILDGEFTVLNKDKDLNDEKVVKDKEQSDAGIIPSHIHIPSIGVDASVEDVGILDNGQMGVPEDPQASGWFEPGTQPGSRGNAVIAGHVDSRTGPAVFYDLKKLQIGDEIKIQDEEGDEKVYIVEKLESYPMEDSPIEKIFGSTNEKRLNLITCTGEFVRDRGGHQDRLVVYSKLKEPEMDQKDITPPAKVQVQGTFVTWHAVREDYVAGYRVYKSKGGEDFQKVASISKHERKTLVDAEASEHQYYVTTVNQDGQESSPSKIVGKSK